MQTRTTRVQTQRASALTSPSLQVKNRPEPLLTPFANGLTPDARLRPHLRKLPRQRNRRAIALSTPAPLAQAVLPETDAFAAFVQAQRAPLYAFLRARCNSAEDAEDIAQDCMERLMRYRSHAEDELRLLLYRIARNRLADLGRAAPAALHQPLAEHDVSEAPSPTPSPLRQAESRQMLNTLRQALLKLPERCREAYLLNRINGMSYSQIAHHRGITAKTVEKQIARALQGLRRELGSDAFSMDGDGR